MSASAVEYHESLASEWCLPAPGHGRPRRVGVRGCGIITPAADTPAALLDLLDSVEARAGGGYRRQLEASELCAASGLSPRVTKKVDRFSLLGVAAAQTALSNAGLDAKAVERCGIMTGNMMAGWTYTEPQLRALHASGIDSVSPYLATAWFPAAPQGQITINLRMRGFAKTIATDRCAGAQAIGLAYERIRCGHSDLLLAGGVEAPVTPFVESACAQLHTPADNLAEAAAYLLLSSEPAASTFIGSHVTFTLPVSTDSSSHLLEQRVRALADSLPEDLTVETVVCNVPACAAFEAQVSSVLKAVFADPTLEFVFPTRLLGDSLAASGAVSAVVAHEKLARKRSPSSALVVSLGHQCGDLLWMYHE